MLSMNSDLSQSANNDPGTAYRRNQVKSCCFLGILFLSLLIALVLSGVYALYFFLTCRIACGHVICRSDTRHPD